MKTAGSSMDHSRIPSHPRRVPLTRTRAHPVISRDVRLCASLQVKSTQINTPTTTLLVADTIPALKVFPFALGRLYRWISPLPRGSVYVTGPAFLINDKLPGELMNMEIFYILKEANLLFERWRKFCSSERPHLSPGYRSSAAMLAYATLHDRPASSWFRTIPGSNRGPGPLKGSRSLRPHPPGLNVWCGVGKMCDTCSGANCTFPLRCHGQIARGGTVR